MKFRTCFCIQKRFFSSPGNRFRKNYIRQGSKLIENGIEDVYDSIQKAANGNCIEDLIRRARGGDSAAIPAPVDSYGDVSGMPTDLLGMHDILTRCHDSFNSLSAEVKKSFNNDFDFYLKSLSDGSFTKLLQPLKPSNPDVDMLSHEELQKIRSLIGGKE